MYTEPTAGLLEQIHARAVTNSATAWLETHGAILDKDRSFIQAPDIHANKLQLLVDEIIRWCEANGIPCRIVGLKARQVGLSTISVASAYQACRSRPTNFLLIGDEYEKSVKNLKEMFERFAEHDTYDWQNSFNRPSGKFSNESAMVTETANDNRAGASGTYQRIVATEVAHWKETKSLSAQKVFLAFMACVPKTKGTVVVVESTANGVGNAYHTIYSGAITFEELQIGKIPIGWNGFVKVFLSWHEFPEYTSPITEQEAVEIMASLDEREAELLARFPESIDAGRLKWRRQIISSEFLGNDVRFEEEYPSDEDSAFLATGGKVFPARHMKMMMDRAQKVRPSFGSLTWQSAGYGPNYPSFHVELEREAWLRVYEMPRPGLRYLLAVDPATGRTTTEDPDCHGAQVWRMGFRDVHGIWHPMRMVARLADCGEEMSELIKTRKIKSVCRWDMDILEGRIGIVSAWYGRCMIAPEANRDGGLIRNLMRNGYPMVRVQKYNKATDRLEDFWGFDTTEDNRDRIIRQLVGAVRRMDDDGEGIEIPDPAVVQEMQVFIRLKTGRTEAAGGWHDDQVLAAAFAEELKEQATLMLEPTVRREDELAMIARTSGRRAGKRHKDSTFR